MGDSSGTSSLGGYMLTAIVSLLLIVGLYWYMPTPGNSFAGAEFYFDASGDPSRGDPLPSILASPDAYGRTIEPGSKRLFVVNGGSCTGCSISAISFDLLPTSDFDVVCVIYSADVGDIEAALGGTAPEGVLVFADPSEENLSELNAAWIGRWYEYKEGVLTDFAQDIDDASWSKRSVS